MCNKNSVVLFRILHNLTTFVYLALFEKLSFLRTEGIHGKKASCIINEVHFRTLTVKKKIAI